MRLHTNKYIVVLCILFSFLCVATSHAGERSVSISKERLLDKIKGGWAGQTFACTYGGPTEFRYNGCMIPDSVDIPWPDGYCKWYFDNEGGLYDDVYMDLTFVEAIDRYGIDVSVDTLANAFAYAGYKLWHANQAARYNIINGIKAPQSGFWRNNPHADDIDFQIEADFAGLMSPGMPNSAAEICDRVGHIMNYGDGWYGGVYVAAMYSLAFVLDDMEQVVRQALPIIPVGSNYRRCMEDVIGWCESNSDWKRTWQMIEAKWVDEINCPKGTGEPFNIDAKVNSAYVVMGLLYGGGDMDRTIEIATRCGADSDCNPATAAGILGTMLGYSNISEKWLSNLHEVEDINFDHTDISLNKVYGMSFDHALEMIRRAGGRTNGRKVTVRIETPHPVALEQGFEGLELVVKDVVQYKNFRRRFSRDFEGSAVVCEGRVNAREGCPDDYVARLRVSVDSSQQIVEMPVDFAVRRADIYWNYNLPQGKHNISIEWLNPIVEANVVMNSILIYRQTTK